MHGKYYTIISLEYAVVSLFSMIYNSYNSFFILVIYTGKYNLVEAQFLMTTSVHPIVFLFKTKIITCRLGSIYQYLSPIWSQSNTIVFNFTSFRL